MKKETSHVAKIFKSRDNVFMKTGLQAKLFLFFCVLAIMGGCAPASHFQEIVRLQGYANEKDRQQNWVKKQDRDFDRLFDLVRCQSLPLGLDQRQVLRKFGEPIFPKMVRLEGKDYEVWLYRHSTKYLGVDKVYLYFDNTHHLRHYDFVLGSSHQKPGMCRN